MTDTKRHHYTESGLDNVWLAGGFEETETPYGKGVAIHDIDGLHRCIADWLLHKPEPLTGGEFRFLRMELDLSQGTMGGLCGRNERCVRDWESSDKVPEPANRIIRVIYRERYDPNATFEGMSKEIEELQRLDREVHELRLKVTKEGWVLENSNCEAA
jgi:putative transcriptional regulator